jgi:surface polysaccharide O-acyltransferase-like enzyme
MLKKQHLINVDIIRIIAGLSVVFIHASDSFLIYPPNYGIGGLSYLFLSFLNVASRICVPLFILLSGYLLLKPEKIINIKNFYMRRLSKIGIPFVFWLVAYYITQSSRGAHISLGYILNSLYSTNIGILYFLVIIFELYLITPFLIKLLKSNKKTVQVIFILSIIITIASNILSLYIPFVNILTTNVFTIFVPYISYYVGGYYLGNVSISSTQKVFVIFGYWVALLFTFFSTDAAAVTIINGTELQFNNINVLVMSFLLFTFFINNSFLKQRFSNFQFIKTIGSSIFGIYLIHPYIFILLDACLRLQPDNIQHLMVLFVFIKSITVFGVSLLIVIIARRLAVINKVFGS